MLNAQRCQFLCTETSRYIAVICETFNSRMLNFNNRIKIFLILIKFEWAKPH